MTAVRMRTQSEPRLFLNFAFFLLDTSLMEINLDQFRVRSLKTRELDPHYLLLEEPAMSLLRCGIALTAVVLLAPVLTNAQPPKPGAGKPGDPPPPVTRGQLPTYWKQLGLTDEQKAQVYGVQGKYRAQIAALERQIKALRAEQRKDLEKILTDAQKTRLKEIISSRTPGAGGKPPQK